MLRSGFLLAALLPFTPAAGEGAKKPFLGREQVALLEVRQAQPQPSPRAEGPGYSAFRLLVEVKDTLPRAAAAKQFEVTIHHASRLAFAPIEVQNWFPVEPGARVAVAYDGDWPPRPVDLVRVSDGTEPADASWQDCAAFHRVTREGQGPTALAAMIRGGQHRPGATFFRLLDHYDRRLFNDPQVTLACAAYLRDRRAPLAARVQLTRFLGTAGRHDREGNRALAAALVDLVLEANGARLPAGRTDDVLLLLSWNCVAGRDPTDLPDLTDKAREALLALAQDGSALQGGGQLLPLLRWLRGIAPDEVTAGDTGPGRSPESLPQGRAAAPKTPDEASPRNDEDREADPSGRRAWIVWGSLVAVGTLLVLFRYLRRGRA